MAPSLRQFLRRDLPKGNGDVKLGTGQVPGNSFNNAGFLALFAIIGGFMVLAAIYFFFIAKNGGFKRITKDDWEDYKSTVLRRKGPDGKTLSNATKSTKLGGGSVVPKWAKSDYTRSTESSYDDGEMREVEEGRGYRNIRQTSRHDPELAAYKHEKAAKVGGINTSMHGSQWDYSNTDRSDVTPAPAVDKKELKRAEKERRAREKAEQKEAARLEKEQRKQQKKSKATESEAGDRQAPRRSQPSAAYSFQQGDDAESSVYTAPRSEAQTRHTQSSIRQVSYYESYRPGATQLPPLREQPTPAPSQRSGDGGRRSHRASRESMSHASSSRQGSPRKQHRSGAPRSDYSGSSDTGTKVYEHHIPGLSKGEVGVEDSVSQVGARRHRQPPPSASSGYRRGGAGRARGDSLSESDI
ncbi:uncharacterized protein PV09_04412 [Verruconis gallopava]|uniref:Endosomal spry domain-containing protein n=1 Tax=Verruconis gallopava TaxID=253628 RepID=A0A0D1XQ25_9PEZI|nr:uncharacterized protein PV09_04412 [Verruconis gallopava]KIW04676.1 hypothetical protein PV09_04412 [Verruconis gallopava]